MRAGATGVQADAAVAAADVAGDARGKPELPEPPGLAGRYTVRSVARALQLVDIVANGPAEGQSLSDLARELGASKSTTLALARTLVAAGLLRDTRPGPRYTLGTALIRLGDIARKQLPLGDLCRPLLERAGRPDQDDLAGRDLRRGLPGVHRAGGRPGQRPFLHPARPARGAARLGGGQGDPVDHGPRQRCGRICAETGLPAADRAHDHRHRLAARGLASVRAAGFAVDDEEDADGSSAWARRSSSTTGPARARSASPASRVTCPPGRSTSSAGPCAGPPTEISEQLGGRRYADSARLRPGAIG